MTTIRDRIEQIENAHLSEVAVQASQSRGRRHPDAPHEYRTCFARDRDRIIHSRAFRRLEYKTQVFVNSVGDHYRTRLTHTIEVAHISRAVARALSLNEDLAEAVALAHDLGHPPFGHSGEATLRDLMRSNGGFEHNLQGLRIVDTLERHTPGRAGLNLTYEVRESFVKHSASPASGAAAERIISDAGINVNEQLPLESQLCALTDEIAYNSHDIDDGLRSGLIRPDALNDLDLWRRARAVAVERCGDSDPRGLVAVTLRRLIDILATDLIDETSRRVIDSGCRSVWDIRSYPAPLAGFSEPVALAKREVESFLYSAFYEHPVIRSMFVKHQAILADLFNAYMRKPDELPDKYRSRIDNPDPKAQAVCDYIAGMTDRFAVERHQALTGKEAG